MRKKIARIFFSYLVIAHHHLFYRRECEFIFEWRKLLAPPFFIEKKPNFLHKIFPMFFFSILRINFFIIINGENMRIDANAILV